MKGHGKKHMQKNEIKIINAKTVNEVLYHLKNIANLEIIAGSTLCEKNYNGTSIKLPVACLFIGNIDELKEVNRTERFIEFGASVTFNQMLELGKKRLPSPLFEAISTCATHTIANTATIGGNICYLKHKLSLYSPLLALDASLELRSSSETRHISLSKFYGLDKGFFLTKIRVPVYNWQTIIYKKIGRSFLNGASFTFLADSSKGALLDDLRIAYAGDIVFRSRELENTLIGSRLPLTNKEIFNLLEKASKMFEDAMKNKNDKIQKDQFMNLLEQSLEELKHY